MAPEFLVGGGDVATAGSSKCSELKTATGSIMVVEEVGVGRIWLLF